MTPSEISFAVGFFFGALALVAVLAVLATFAKRFLKLHICEGHAQHEHDLSWANPNLRPPTPTK